MNPFRGLRASRYIFAEMLPGFILGVVVFVFILLMFQALRLTEFLLIHGVNGKNIGNMVLYMTVSLLPAIFPMSLIFTVLLTYGRLSNDSEITAFKSIGLNMFHLATPALILGVLVSLISAKTSFDVGPWGNRQFEILTTKLSQSKATATIREGTFSESFFNLVVYANKVDTKANVLTDVFIYDERGGVPVTVVAKKGILIQEKDKTGIHALLRLLDGSIHRSGESYTRINFDKNDIYLIDPAEEAHRNKSMPSLTLSELRDNIAANPAGENVNRYKIEISKRWAVTVACLLFAIIGVGLGTQTNKRAVKAGGMVLSLGIIVGYWTLFLVGETMAKNGTVPIWLGTWLANIVCFILSIWSIKKSWA